MANATFNDKQTKEVGKIIMILVYGEKINNTWEHFKIKMKDPENFLR